MKTTGLRWRIVATFALFAILGLFVGFWGTIVHDLIEPKLAAQQVEHSATPYVMLRALAGAENYIVGFILALIGLVWATFFAPLKSAPPAACCVLALFICGCGPARVDVFEDLGPNDTAFVTPLTGDNLSSGKKFNSVEYLDSQKVSAKRIVIPLMQKNTGRMWWDYEWIPAVKVWKVQRALVSREWTSGSLGSKKANEGIPVVTKDAIKLSLGVAITTYIEEKDAAAYLYYHGEQSLAAVTDNNIRNYCVAELTREYSQIDLQAAKTNGPTIFAKLQADATLFFKTKGITISQVGNAEGFEFQDPTIQKGINERFLAEQRIATAQQAKLAQDELNKQTVATAQAQVDAAQKLMQAKEAATLQNQLEIQLMTAKAALAMAEKWDGRLPANILPSNSPMLMSLSTSPRGTNSP